MTGLEPAGFIHAALAIVVLLEGMMVSMQPAALCTLLRCRIRSSLGSAVNARLMDQTARDECAAPVSEGAAQ